MNTPCMFGQDLMHCIKNHHLDVTWLFILWLIMTMITEIVIWMHATEPKDFFSMLHSNLFYAKAIDKGVDLNWYSTHWNIKEIELPKYVCYGAFMEFIRWKASEITMFHLKNEVTSDYKPEECFISCVTENEQVNK